MIELHEPNTNNRDLLPYFCRQRSVTAGNQLIYPACRPPSYCSPWSHRNPAPSTIGDSDFAGSWWWDDYRIAWWWVWGIKIDGSIIAVHKTHTFNQVIISRPVEESPAGCAAVMKAYPALCMGTHTFINQVIISRPVEESPAGCAAVMRALPALCMGTHTFNQVIISRSVEESPAGCAAVMRALPALCMETHTFNQVIISRSVEESPAGCAAVMRALPALCMETHTFNQVIISRSVEESPAGCCDEGLPCTLYGHTHLY